MTLMLADLAKWMFNFVCSGVAIYYFTYVAQNEKLLATYILISNILCVVGSYLAKNMAKNFPHGPPPSLHFLPWPLYRS